MASLVVETQLEKDVASSAGVIPIWPWLDDDKKTKDGLPPHIYANMLLEAKRQNDEEGVILRCNDPKCERVRGIGTKAMFWRSEDTSESIVPPGWVNFGGLGQYTMCPNCRAEDIQDVGLDEDREDGRVDINLKHGSTGSTGASDKPLRRRVSLPTRGRPNKRRKLNKKPGLKRRASEIFKNHPEHLKAVLKQIDDDERKKRADAAESRKKTGGKKRRKTRRRKRTKKRRKSRRRKLTRKRRKSRRRRR